MEGSILTLSMGSWMELPNLKIKEWNEERNPNNCSNFRAELLVIEKGLTECKNSNKNIWILSDSLSAIQHTKDINSAKEKTTIKIIKILKNLTEKLNHVPMDPLSR
ncbi:hypothetical protein LAZ67_X000007 [Cordylochernes scorpioides]|uniref:RNase H type-1 domain-containing protein n=1 Tax=Cordylochernes scorpioides TaxID=51811 RepID=A0ABY6LTC1_9ARAC|nr:hypothetical protein LAZ67_X000007 [Cordylochernes scorpioides]